MVVFHVSTFILQLHTAGGYDFYAQKIDLKGKSFKAYLEKFSESVSAKTDLRSTFGTIPTQ